MGESKVDSKLNPWFFGKVEHRQINNLILVDENGYSHQIDHIEIRHNGIFCIETKNYSGWLFGNETDSYWTQVLYNSKYRIYNPLKQNKTHIYHINKVLGNKYRINPLVVLVQNNSRRIDSNEVIDLMDMKNYLKRFDDGTCYYSEEMDQIYNKLVSCKSGMSNLEHVNNVRQARSDLEQNICPRCKGKLVEREGRYGKFYGCSNYPNCVFTKKII